MTMPRSKKKLPSSKTAPSKSSGSKPSGSKPSGSKPSGSKGPPSRRPSKAPASKKTASKAPTTGKGPSKSPFAKGGTGKGQTNAPTKPINPFGEKKQSAGKKWGSGSKAFKARQEDEELEIKLSDRDAALVNNIKAKLQQIRDYKAILAEDGLKPDEADKAKESALIQRLLKMEKAAKIEARQRAKVAKTEAFRENAEREMFAREKKKGRADRYTGEDGEGDGKSDDDNDDLQSYYDEEDDQDDDDLDDE